MANEGDKKAPSSASNVVTNQKLLQVAEGAAKRVSELSKVISELQKSAEESASLATSMLASIQSNNDKIDQIETRTSKVEEGVKNNKVDLTACMARLERLENKSRLSKEIDDQDSKIRSLHRRINPQELKRASSYVALHGLPLPVQTLSDKELSMTIAENISAALGKEITKYVFLSKDNLFTNIAGWFCQPGGDGHIYNKACPEFAKNSIIFNTSSRIQAIHLESKIRGALIVSQDSRKATDFEGLELGFYTDSPKVKALFKLLLYKGKLLTGAVDQLSHYRVGWRGGAKRNDSGSIPQLSLELKASKDYISRREGYFFKDGHSIRSIWTEDKNVMLSDLPNIWFARKPEPVQQAEEQVQLLSNNIIERDSSSPDLSNKSTAEKSDKRKRDSPGLAGNRAKEAHIDVNAIATIEEDDENSPSDSEDSVHDKNDDVDQGDGKIKEPERKIDNEADLKPKGGGRGKATSRTSNPSKTVSDFPPLTGPKGNTQKKISALFTPAKKLPAAATALPIPKFSS